MIGIIQGRLSKAPKNRLQFFPYNWKLEFEKAKECGFDYIEFFSERKLNKNNPIWNDIEIKKYIELSKKNKLNIFSFVDDYIISNSIENRRTVLYLKKLIKNISRIKIKKLILPLYGKSVLKKNNQIRFARVFNNLMNYGTKYKIQILIESNIDPENFFLFKKKLKKNIYIVLDTGNRVNFNRDLYEDILKFNKHIKHIHIKDKNKKNENVVLGKGNVNFIKLSQTLKKINYTGNYTIESSREDNPEKTAKKNLGFLKKKLSIFSNKF